MKRRLWTQQEDDIIRTHYPHMINEEIQELLPHRTNSMIYNRAHFLGVRKTIETITRKQELCGNLAAEVGKATHFKKGNEPFNKGKKQNEYMSAESIEKTKATRFKKGSKPHNTKSDRFSVRKDSKGRPYVFFKIEDGVWVHYHRYLYEQKHGEIPKGMVIRFKDGNFMNLDINNLEMVSRQENMTRNSFHKLPTEIKELKLLIKTLNGRINKKSKQLN